MWARQRAARCIGDLWSWIAHGTERDTVEKGKEWRCGTRNSMSCVSVMDAINQRAYDSRAATEAYGTDRLSPAERVVLEKITTSWVRVDGASSRHTFVVGAFARVARGAQIAKSRYC
jgi:hypothetical protein